MKKSFFKILFIMILMFPTIILADSVSIKCGTNKIELNKTTSCTLSGTTSSAVSSISARLSSNDFIKITDIKNNLNIWQGDGLDGRIELYAAADDPSGTFNIVTFNVTGIKEGNGQLDVTNVIFNDSNFVENSINGTKYNITIIKPTNPTPSNPSEPTNPTPSNPSVNLFLKSLSVNPGILNFSKNVFEYDVEVDENVTSISISAVAEDSNVKVVIPNNLKLIGEITTFEINVVGVNNQKKIYKINVKKNKIIDEDTSLNIKNIKIENVVSFIFDKNKTDYVISTKDDKLLINVELENSNSTYKIYDNDNLKNGDIVSIVVTSNNGSEKKYSLKILKQNKKEISNKLKLPIILVILEVLWIILLILYIRMYLKIKK